MATTYGYGGEFSSDEDLDKLEQRQQADRVVQNKFDSSRQSKTMIEDAISTIKSLPFDQEVQLSDETLAALLDYYKTPRGPIVDSTRKLYHKIVLRNIRGSQAATEEVAKETNGNSSNNNDNIINNNSIDIIHKSSQQSADTFSSDDDNDNDSKQQTKQRPLVLNRRNPDARVAPASAGDEANKMDVDSEVPAAIVRETKQVDVSTTDDNSDDSDETSDGSEELDSDSDSIEVTPIIRLPAPPASSREKQGIEALMAVGPTTPKQPEVVTKRPQPLAQSTPKTPAEMAKKPYTRSQRVATRSATRGTRAAESSSKKDTSGVSTSCDVVIEKKRTSNRTYTLISAAILMLVIALLTYYFRANIKNSSTPLFGKKIMF